MLEEGTTGRDVLDIADIWLKELEVKEKEFDTIDFLSGFFLIVLFVATLASIPFRNKELTEFWLICDFCVGASLAFVRLMAWSKSGLKK